MEQIFTIVVLLFFAIHLLAGYGRRSTVQSKPSILCTGDSY